MYATAETIALWLRSTDGTGRDEEVNGTFRVTRTEEGIEVFERVEFTRGYSIGYDEIRPTPEFEGEKRYFLGVGDLVGAWYDPEEDRVILDKGIYFDGPRDIAETLARELNQKAIWAWASGEVIDL